MSGLNFFISFSASNIPRNALAIFLTLYQVSLLWNLPARMCAKLYPAFLTRSFSIPVFVPTNMISLFGSFFNISFATAIPGLMCPPLPAHAIITLIIHLSFLIVFRYSKYHSHCN